MRLTRAEVAAAGALVTLGLAALLVLGRPPGPTPPAIDATPTRLDLNAATQDELALLPDVGATMAERLVRGRPYRAVDGARPILGEALYARVAPYLTVAGR